MKKLLSYLNKARTVEVPIIKPPSIPRCQITGKEVVHTHADDVVKDREGRYYFKDALLSKRRFKL